jgi:hypothetical protein
MEHAPLHREFNRRPQLPQAGAVSFGPRAELALQLLFREVSESMGNHDSEIVDASSVD